MIRNALYWAPMLLLHLSVAGYAQVSIPPVPRYALVVNEVLLDPMGQDAGNEWVELYNTSTANISISGMLLKDQAGVVLATLPNYVVPGHGYVVVHLGPTVTDIADGNPADKYANYFTNQAAGNYLPNSAGGVYLQKSSAILDAVFWGTGAPPSGSGYTAAVNAGQWPSGAYVNISFAGGNPLQEGDSIGRDTFSTDTNTAADFFEGGGKNAANATPGGRNDMFLFSHGMAVHWAQSVVNELLLFVGSTESFGISVTNASHWNVVESDPDMVGGFSVSAMHDIQITSQGVPKTLSGSLVATYDRVGTPLATSFTMGVSGTLTASDGTSLTVNYSMGRSGFHSMSRQITGTNTFSWTEFGSTSSYTSSSTMTIQQIGQDSWTVVDSRQSTDWGGASKTSSATTRRTRLGDGQYREQSTLNRTAPPFPPPPGSGSQTIVGTERHEFDQNYVLSADYGITKTFNKNTYSLFDTGGTKIMAGELVQPGSYTITRASGNTLSPLGAWNLQLSFQVRVGFPVIDPNDPGSSFSYSDAINRAIVNGDELIESGTGSWSFQSSVMDTWTYYIDGPVAQGTCGCGCGGTDCSCGGSEDLTTGDKLAIAGGVGLATAVCTAGTIATSPATVTLVGVLLPAGIAGVCAVGGALWWLFY